MANTKEYRIVINGVQESVKAVDSLNDALGMLEQKIKNLSQASINVSSSSSSSSRQNNTSTLQQEDALLKQIQSTEQQIANARREEYQQLLAEKDLLKEVTNQAQQRAAQERLAANTYSNSMSGLKQKLADIKRVMQTTDLGNDDFKKLTTEANNLNEKLKQLEQAYGQFGRSVGDYSSAFKDAQKISVQIGNTTREFNSVRDATRQLTNELKAMVINGQENTKEFNELSDAVHKFEMASRQAESALNDLKTSSQGMDDMLDMFESFGALGSIGQGLSAFFGFDNDDMQRSIQKLVALQNVLQGIEKLRQQMNTKEGFGKILAKGNDAIDKFTAKITGAKIGLKGLEMQSRAATVAVKLLNAAIKGLVAFGAIEVIMFLVDKVTQAFGNMRANADSTRAKMDALNASINALGEAYKARRDELTANFAKGVLSNEEFLTKQNQLQAQYLADQITLLRERNELLNEFNKRYFTFLENLRVGGDFTGQHMNDEETVKSYSWISSTIPMFTEIVHNIEDVEEEWRKCNQAIREGKDYFDKWGSGFENWLDSLFVTVNDTERVMVGLGNIRISDFVASFYDLQKAFSSNSITAEEYAAKLAELKRQMNSSDVLQSVIANLDKYIEDEKVREQIQGIIQELVKLDDAFNMTSAAQIHHWNQVRIDAMKDGDEKIKAQIDENQRQEIEQYGHTQEQINLIKAKYDRQRQNLIDKNHEKEKQKAKQQAKALEDAEKELQRLRIAQMKNGFEKEKAELNEERRERIARAKQMEISSKKRNEIIAEINSLYDKKILDAKRDWAYNIVKTYEDMYSQIDKLSRNTFSTEANAAALNVESKRFNAINNPTSNVDTSGKTAVVLPMFEDNSESTISQYEMYYKRIIDIEEKANNRLNELSKERLANEIQFSKEDEELRHKRQISVETSNLVIAQLEKYANEHNGLLMVANATQEEFNRLEVQLRPQLEKMRGTLVDAYNKGEIDFKSFLSLVEKENAQHNSEMQILEISHQKRLQEIEDNSFKQRQQNTSNYYSSMYNIVKTQEGRIDDILNRTPSTNNWQIFRLNTMRRAYKSTLAEYKTISKQLVNLKEELQRDLENRKISPEDFLVREQELNVAFEQLSEKIRQLQSQQKQLIGNFIQSLQQYYTAVIDSFQIIMQAVWDAQDVAFDKEQDEIDAQLEVIEDKLAKERELIQEHTSAVNEMESELSTARGSRRQYLIDQINAEMAAKRAARKQEQKLEKEKEKAEKRQEELEKKRKKAQYERDLIQAIVNGASAVVYAAMNTWPIPAIPMMALAASTTAAQIAIMSSNKPYAKGGQLEGGLAQGNRHRDGGIKVLGGRAEIEGGEYVTNRLSTSKNLDLLEYINSKKKKIDISDLIDFYSGKTVKKSVSSISRTKFDSGGVLPSMTNDYDMDDRLLNAFETYSNRPVYVSVVDINNRQTAISNVKVLAGLDA